MTKDTPMSDLRKAANTTTGEQFYDLVARTPTEIVVELTKRLEDMNSSSEKNTPEGARQRRFAMVGP